jgi:hypothetical protein
MGRLVAPKRRRLTPAVVPTQCNSRTGQPVGFERPEYHQYARLGGSVWPGRIGGIDPVASHAMVEIRLRRFPGIPVVQRAMAD